MLFIIDLVYVNCWLMFSVQLILRQINSCSLFVIASSSTVLATPSHKTINTSKACWYILLAEFSHQLAVTDRWFFHLTYTRCTSGPVNKITMLHYNYNYQNVQPPALSQWSVFQIPLYISTKFINSPYFINISERLPYFRSIYAFLHNLRLIHSLPILTMMHL